MGEKHAVSMPLAGRSRFWYVLWSVPLKYSWRTEKISDLAQHRPRAPRWLTVGTIFSIWFVGISDQIGGDGEKPLLVKGSANKRERMRNLPMACLGFSPFLLPSSLVFSGGEVRICVISWAGRRRPVSSVATAVTNEFLVYIMEHPPLSF